MNYELKIFPTIGNPTYDTKSVKVYRGKDKFNLLLNYSSKVCLNATLTQCADYNAKRPNVELLMVLR